ncbi:hypothetical protein [Corallococcus llansteffanensis]|uniref:hypothetical protein n=1 Tax=Corallococcus llansteffanensis TaxID=2316731 RepID=UPI0011C3816C|nr:hypothetical protein [Corallococcus llansteffanensis]
MWDPRDRRDLACLGLMVLVYGLAVAPVLHAVVGHGGGLEGHAHGHGHGPGGHVHRTGSPAEQERFAPGEAPEAPDGADGDGQHGHGHQHLTGSVEHLLAVAASWTVFLPPASRWMSWSVEQARAPEWRPGQRWRSPAMPQGP